MAKSMNDAAATLVHYIELLAERAGLDFGGDERAELKDAVEAFREAEKALYAANNPNP